MVRHEPERIDEDACKHQRSRLQGVSSSLHEREQQVGSEGKQDGQPTGDEQLRLEDVRGLDGVEDRSPETVLDQEGGDSRDRDRRDGRDAEASEDGGRGERQLDPEKGLEPGQSHPARRLEHVGGDGAQAGDDVPVEDEQGVRGQRDLDGRHGEPRQRNEQLEQREARDRVEKVREAAPSGASKTRQRKPISARTNAIPKPTPTAISVS